jgi:hypothetical protein
MVTFIEPSAPLRQRRLMHAGVLDLDVARQRGGVGLQAFDRADDPVDQVDVVAGLVHEGAAVEFPGAAPLGAVVVLVRAGPEHVQVDHVDAAEALFLDRALEQLQRGVAAVLLDHEQAHAGRVAGAAPCACRLPSAWPSAFR